ncbi:MAG: GHMP kinase [Acidobacteriota bacterium]
MITTEAYARAGLLGNPSDGYYGKIIAISVKDFSARVSLQESEKIQIKAAPQDKDIFRDGAELVERVSLYGYYGGARLVKAALKVFFDYCLKQNIRLENKNFTISYTSTIPRQVGLGGSSAIIVAVMRALLSFYKVEIPLEFLPTLVLHAELKELGINAGFMDRVVQVYEGCVFLDLDRELVQKKGHGRYERLDPDLLPPLYLAYKSELGKVSGQVLNEIRLAFDRGDPFVVETLRKLASLAEEGRRDFLSGDVSRWPALMNENFDLRSRIMRIGPSNMEMIQAARSLGASAKFAGSGGSIIGIYKGEGMFSRLAEELGRLGAKIIKPRII